LDGLLEDVAGESLGDDAEHTSVDLNFNNITLANQNNQF